MSTMLESFQGASSSSVTPELFRRLTKDRSGEYEISVRLLHEFGAVDGTGYFGREKLAELAALSAKHDILFSDSTEGRKLETFFDLVMDPRGVWYEFFRLDSEEPVGVAYITRVIPGYDASAHFAFWDSIAAGREGLIRQLMYLTFDRYQLRRLSVEVPRYQSGTIRFIKRLGFTGEGEKRDAVLRKGAWFPLVLFGMTRDELSELLAEEER